MTRHLKTRAHKPRPIQTLLDCKEKILKPFFSHPHRLSGFIISHFGVFVNSDVLRRWRKVM